MVRLALLGMPPVQRNIVNSLCKLSRNRRRHYHVVTCGGLVDADILLVDGDDRQALAAWRSQADGKPTVLIGKNGHQRAPYQLKPSQLAGHLLRTLDAVTDRELGDRGPQITAVSQAAGKAVVPMYPVEPGRGANAVAGRILVVDDSLSVRTQMRICLETLNVAVEFAESAEQGIDLFLKRSFDLVFMDVMLPGIDGYHACKSIKDLGPTCRAPVVMLTSKSSPFNKVKGVMAGCDRYITKPTSEKELRATVVRYIPDARRNRPYRESVSMEACNGDQ